MYNWSTDETKLGDDPQKKTIWKIQQMVNFGLNGEKISEKKLREFWNVLEIDKSRRNFLNMLLHAR
ncbi:MAG: hypothetical protein A3C85_03690 [Candidatus Doudnabacteria bacterium RIFCSPHIGHO2_02_FULL_48_21]|uniref:Uncharacterized protein n=1 Tax=Candidatus Doudnabacteria bacterium RIFCSPLOWO2_02_FULL_48_13 TaxID=1817845 RepID=A0A1F5QC21_9BACT|nr:MAG: hypothetical protein A3K05_03185 [Candidatus Doudnabacteria bacterium RIFCSPHIGHO2_01_48_18]OGE79612.1 MAG: hypothetical protein A2668_01305 [Candidatus Doudnabacteria bacterium RIFCSPHIGHO2_01_FULL_48_180]OGE91746.1 MAG: hypothetical protein A3F44_00030 [Candidatus Doudnabacteria bacterium RIFCSPHIGHO2_12_FULL_47_25]OGE93559.1 MAG: hypothetical protein A3C85_03690 [Candidatus Doudnabacteria bacterium RIFCSPHIGHO2_02_FULL_48_21]OGE96324.1 MAG: hypothetical protein A3A83_00145 [Candidatu